MKTKSATLAISALLVCAALAWKLSGTTQATITTDQKLYSVGQNIIINGSGFSPSALVSVSVVRPDQQTDIVPGVTTGTTGAFTATYTPPLEPGRYKITATDGVNSATTASTEADAVGYNKDGYVKAAFAPENTTGNWSSGNQGKFYLENQWTFDQYEVTGVGAASSVPDFDVNFNHFQSATGALFIDALADFRACVDCTTDASAGLLLDADPLPPSDTTAWVVATSAISHINKPLNSAANGSGTTVTSGSSGFCSSDTNDALNTPSEFHCFHVSGSALAALFPAATFATGTHTITLFYAGHLAASFVWGNGTAGIGGHEGSLGDCTTSYYVHPYPSGTLTLGASFEPTTGGCPGGTGIPVYGTDAYIGWTTPFLGVGFASGSSRHWSMANQTGGSSGAIEIPIPTVAAPSNTIVITKQTVPANATASFPYTSAQLGGFSLTNPFPASKTFTSIAPGVEYDVTEGAVTGWTLTGLACAVTAGTDDGTGTWPTGGNNPTAAIILGATDSGVTVTCTYTNTGTGHIIVQKHTTPTGTSTSFPFTTSGTGYAGFSLMDGGSNDSGSLSAGAYSVTESAVAGWALASRTCSLTVTGSGTSTFPASGTTQPANISLGAGDTVTCVYNNVKPDARITLTPLTATNEIGSPHTFTATVQMDNTGTGTFVNAPDGTLVTFSLPTNGASATFVGGTNTCTTVSGVCSVSVTATTVGSATIRATTTFSVLGSSLTRTTNDGLSGDSTDATKHWVDANITITPNVATNLVGNAHTFTVTVTQLPDSATPATSAVIAAMVTPTPSSITDNCSGTKTFSGNTITCTIVINSTSMGTFTAHASANIAFPSGPTLTRATGDTHAGDTADAVKHYVDGNITIAPSAVNEVGHAHTFTVTATQIPDGSTPATTANITPNISPAAAQTGTTCGAAVSFNGGNTATCTVTVNSSTVQTITANASASFSINGATVSVATGDSHAGDGPAATKKYVDAGITITPSAVNEVGHAHTFTITYTQIPGTATAATTASITPNISPAAAQTGTTCSAAVAFSGNTATCTVTVNSSTVQTITANATGSASVGGVALTRSTGDSNANDGPAATKSYVDANVSITPSATNEVGQAHIFTITVNAIPGTVTPVMFTSITPNVSPTPGTDNSTCGSPTVAGNTATCTVTINSTTAGVFTANATAVVTMGGVAVTRATGDGKTGDSGPAVKTYIAPGTMLTFKSQSPSGANVEAGTLVTIVVTEANTGNVALTNENVTGGGSCLSFTPANVPTLAVGASQDFTCTFTAVAGTNSWFADGHGTDPLGNPAPSANEHQSGSFFGDQSSTSLTFNSGASTASPVEAGSTVTVVVTEANTGNNALTGVSVTGGGSCTSFSGGSATLAVGASTNFTCTFTAVAGTNSWNATGHATDSAGVAVSTVGETAMGSVFGDSSTTSLTFNSALSSPPSATASVQAGTSVTVVVTETNTGNNALTGVSVSGTGACAASGFTGGSSTLAIGATTNFTCTFTSVQGSNAWTATGHGTDSAGRAVSTNGETAQGNVTGLLSTLILVKNTVGGNGTFNFAGTGSGVTSAMLTTSGFTQMHAYQNILSGPKSLTETVPAGWLGNTTQVSCQQNSILPGGTAADLSGSYTTGTVAASGTVTASFNNLGVGTTVTCTFTNALLPTLTIIKGITGTGTAAFSFPVTGANPMTPTITPPSAPSSAQFGPVVITTGNNTISESGPPSGWTLTDFACSGYSGGGTGAGPLDSNGVPTNWNFTDTFGDAVVCSFINSNAKTTRTQGFWATHTALSDGVWGGNGTTYPVNGSGSPVINPADPSPAGSPDAYMCGVLITAVPTNEENILMGGFWSNIAQKSGKGGKRASIDQARMQMIQQYLAAVLNSHMFGSAPPSPFSAYRADYCGTNENAIKADVGILGNFNQSGDNLAFDPGQSATAQTSKAFADIDAWDTPQFPGQSDADDGPAKLALVKVVSGGTAVTTDFTLSATCAGGACTSANNLSHVGGVTSTTVAEGTYTLMDVGTGVNSAGYTPGSWSCTGTGSFEVSPTTGGTATLAVSQGAVVSCSITNTHP